MDGVKRITELAEEQRLDVVALIWMLSVLVYTGVEIYSALHLFGGRFGSFDGWAKIAALGATGGLVVAVSCLVGIGLALTSESAVAKWSIALAGIVGAWVFVAGVLDLVYATHTPGNKTVTFGTFGGTNRGTNLVGGLALAGLGLVVMMIAWRAGGSRPEPAVEIS